MFGLLKKLFGTAQDRKVRKYSKIVTQVNDWEKQYQQLSDDALKGKTEEFKERIAKGETLDALLPEAYAVVKNMCRRLSGTEIHVSGYDQKWDMIPYDVQIIGAVAIHNGSIIEMQTGEGKTLTSVMPLYLNALSGKSVHLVTVNDYLAQRDCEWMGTIFRKLGLTTAALTNATPTEERKELYQADIVYGTASEFGFDYLRDNSMSMSSQEQVQRGYFFAIIDEVDSILIDEARTPLIISGPVPVSKQMYDELKGNVENLVRMQRDYCNKLATEARRVIEATSEGALTAEQEKQREEAFQKLWLVGKGTPRNKTLMRIKENPDARAEIDTWDLYFYSDANKEEKTERLADLFMIVDERNNEYELTDKGIAAWVNLSKGAETIDDFIMLDISDAFLTIDEDSSLSDEEKMEKKLAVQEEDGKRKERAHNLRQLLRAHLLMEKDVDYIIQEGKIVIIDENTGRPQPGRRFADGLHQSIEAKEGVAIQKETQTYATITLQNFFRMYERLAGMTGTAATEALEFKQIYEIDVLEIPTNRPCIRDDTNDEIYMTEREKYTAILKDVEEVHRQGRPILIGTESVEVSEKLSRIFKQKNLPHTVLNAKNHEKEAEIVAHAGSRGAITIATNMAGRGTDIKLEEGIAETGGLYVLGTTRHQSRRIDRQLRGRCARQGDPGSSKFYVSFEDALMRLFASPRLTTILQKFRPPEGEPISARILNKSIETAQKRVEQRNYMMRKHTLEYDDVMNKQRQEIYSFRNDILHTDSVESLAQEILEEVLASAADQFFRSQSDEGGWDPEGYRQWLMHQFPVSFEKGAFDKDLTEVSELEEIAINQIIEAFHTKIERENSKVSKEHLNQGHNPALNTVRNLMLRQLDKLWQEHLLTMDHLRSDVTLRAVGQRDPLLEFKHEAFALFDQLGEQLKTRIAHDLFRFEILTRPPTNISNILEGMQMETNRSFVPEEGAQEPPQMQQQMGDQSQEPRKLEPVTVGQKVGRNELCPCGSGKKFKRCCGNVE